MKMYEFIRWERTIDPKIGVERWCTALFADEAAGMHNLRKIALEANRLRRSSVIGFARWPDAVGFCFDRDPKLKEIHAAHETAKIWFEAPSLIFLHERQLFAEDGAAREWPGLVEAKKWLREGGHVVDL